MSDASAWLRGAVVTARVAVWQHERQSASRHASCGRDAAAGDTIGDLAATLWCLAALLTVLLGPYPHAAALYS